MSKTLPFLWNESTDAYEARCSDCRQLVGVLTKEYLQSSKEYHPLFMSHRCPTEWKSTPDGTMRVMYVPEQPEARVPEKDRTAMGVTIGIVLGVALIALILTVFWPKTHAAEVSPDQSYITQVRAGTTMLGSIADTDLISLGHKACNARKEGMSQEQTLLNVMTSAQDRTLRNDLTYTIGAAYAAYCPEYTK